MNKLVSIITPCYNGALFVGRCIESILAQAYRPMELFLIDDGSTDNTASVVQSYGVHLNNNNIKLHYIYQENAGPSAALNRGLSLFEGDYLIWLDSDDFLFPDSITKRVAFLEKHPQFGLVRSDGIKTKEEAPYALIWCLSNKKKNRFNTAIFEDLLLSRTFISSGCYMVRRSAFLDANRTRVIYSHRTGQNYQMLLPITYKYECGYIDEPLWAYVVRADSLSHRDFGNSLEKNLLRIADCENIITNVLAEMDGDAHTYIPWVNLKYATQRLALACRFKNRDLGSKYYIVIQKHRPPTLKERWWYLGSQTILMHVPQKIVERLFSIPMRINKKLRAMVCAKKMECYSGFSNGRNRK